MNVTIRSFGYLSICLSICLSACLSVSQSVSLSIDLFIHLSINLSICLSVCLSFCLSVLLSVYLSVFLSFCPSVCLSVCLPGLFFYLPILLSSDCQSNVCLSVSLYLSIQLSTCRLSGLRHSKHNGSATWLGPHTTHSSSSIRSPKQDKSNSFF